MPSHDPVQLANLATTKQQIEKQALDAAARCLTLAATYASAHIDKPLFKKLMRRKSGPAVLVRLDWPGVLRVIDPATGELLAESLPGEPGQLAGEFSARILGSVHG